MNGIHESLNHPTTPVTTPKPDKAVDRVSSILSQLAVSPAASPDQTQKKFERATKDSPRTVRIVDQEYAKVIGSPPDTRMTDIIHGPGPIVGGTGFYL